MESQWKVYSLRSCYTYSRVAGEYIATVIEAACNHQNLKISDNEGFSLRISFDSIDTTIISDTFEAALPCPDYMIPELEEMQDVEIVVDLCAAPKENCEQINVDATCLTTADPELESNAIVHVYASVPTPIDHDRLRNEIIASVVHELRHATQFIVWKWDSNHPNFDETSTDHLASAHEIDARVEEICSYSSLPIQELNESTFTALASKYLKRYIKRNMPTISEEEYTRVYGNALRNHSKYFNKRRQMSEFQCPIEVYASS